MNQPDIDIYGVGICCISLCAPKGVPTNVIEAFVNQEHDVGPELRWHISDDPTFADGRPMPCTCQHNDQRCHWLLVC